MFSCKFKYELLNTSIVPLRVFGRNRIHGFNYILLHYNILLLYSVDSRTAATCSTNNNYVVGI